MHISYNPGLAATPLTTAKTFATASVLWIADVAYLQRFNDFLLRLGTANFTGEWGEYLAWLRPHACCKKGGVGQDEKVTNASITNHRFKFVLDLKKLPINTFCFIKLTSSSPSSSSSPTSSSSSSSSSPQIYLMLYV